MTWKGFQLADLRAYGVRRTEKGIEVPYFTPRGRHWRSKLFRANGGSHWLGKSKPQIPYGLETLKLGGDVIVLTEGESDALALRLAFQKLPVLGMPGASSWQAKWSPYLDEFRVVYLSFDADAAGMNLTASVRFSRPDARVIELPAGADTRDVLQRLGKASYEALVEETKAKQAWKESVGNLSRATSRRREVDEAWEREAAA